MRAHSVRSLDDRVRLLRRLVWFGDAALDPRRPPEGGLRDPRMRRLGLLVTQQCPPRDDMCELKGVFDFTVTNVRYTGDIAFKDTFQSALRTLQFGGGDCLPGDTLLMVRDRGLVPLRHVEPGWEIWGLERWSRVERVWSKGRLPVSLVYFDTGATFRATPDHHVYVAAGHPSVLERVAGFEVHESDHGPLARIHTADLKIGDALPVPREVPAPIVDVTWRSQFGLSRHDFARVIGVHPAVDTVETFDLTTEDHRVYLPEADVTVSQCDDHSVTNAVLAMENGFQTKFRITSNTGATWDHIYCMAAIPKHSPARWIALDTTLGRGKFAREPSNAKFKDFVVGEL